MAVLLQTISARLGVVTGKDLAQACREWDPRALVWPLWVLCEIAIIACDLAEVLGAAIGLQLLFGVPIFKGSAFATEAATVTDVETVRAPLVDALGPAAPSPLTDDSRIELALSQAGRVDLEVFDVAGHHVATLFRGRMEAGRSSVRWSARDGGRESIAAGVYWLRMQTPRSNRTLKLVVMR